MTCQWQKQCFYEHSVRIPFIVRTPEGPAGHRVAGDVSLVDVLPTLFGITGLRVEDSLPGRDLSAAIRGEDEPSEPVFSEYHTIGMANAGYMGKEGRYKYNYYVNHDPELYDLASDPEELKDVSGEAEYSSIRRRLNDVLHDWVDPEAIDQKAKTDQAKPRFNGSRDTNG
ncbi:MAG: sulfatase/phosphatase domain-containing protein [Candidatus Brocadiia bacterium]